MSTSINQEEAVRNLYLYAIDLLNKGYSDYQIEKDLIAKGLSEAAATTIVRNIVDMKQQAIRKNAVRAMQIGAAAFIIGVIITVGSYSAAASSSTGGTYVVTGGAIIYGAWQFIKGLMAYNE